jgi:tetratricopeptide (TPR) repeat protein
VRRTIGLAAEVLALLRRHLDCETIKKSPVAPALLLAAVVLVQSASSSPAPPSTEALGRAYDLFLQGLVQEKNDELSGAIDSFRRAIALLPGDGVIHAQLAGLYARQNQIAEARKEALAAVAVDPGNREAHRLLGSIQAATVESGPPGANQALLAEAVDHFEQALAGDVRDPFVEIALSSLYVRQQSPEKAVAQLQKLLLARPAFPAALRLLVKAYQAMGQSAEVARTLATLGSAPPDAIESSVRRIEWLERSGRWADAARGWSDIVSRDSGSAIYRTRQAGALANSGNVGDARMVLRVETRDSPRNIAAWYLLSLIEGRAGNGPAAEEAAKQIAQIDPNDARGPLSLARARSGEGDHRGAVEALGPRVTAPTPDDLSSGLYAEMASELSSALGELGQQKRAIETLEGARKHAPDDEDLLFTLAAAYEQNRRYDHAERAFRELIGANATHAQALNYLGYMLADRGQKLPEALDLINRALAIDKDNPAYLDSLGWAYYKMGQFGSARAPLERAAQLLPKVSVIQDHLGDLYLQLKRYSDAVAAFERALAGDNDGIDSSAIAKKRDRARGLAGKS